MRAGGELLEMADGRRTAKELWWGHAGGVGQAGVPPVLDALGGLSHRPVRRKKGGWPRAPRETGCGGRELLSGRAGSSGASALGAGRRPAFPPALRASLPGRRGYGQRGVHTRAHTPESMLSAGLGTSCRVASGPGPSLPARCSQSWGRWVLESGSRPLPVALWRPGSGMAFAGPATLLSAAAPAPGNRGADVIPLPEARSQAGGQRPGGVAAYQADPPTVRSPRARTPCSEQTGGGKGV